VGRSEAYKLQRTLRDNIQAGIHAAAKPAEHDHRCFAYAEQRIGKSLEKGSP